MAANSVKANTLWSRLHYIITRQPSQNCHSVLQSCTAFQPLAECIDHSMSVFTGLYTQAVITHSKTQACTSGPLLSQVRSPDAPPKITPIPATARSKIHMTTQRSSFRPQAGSAELYLRDVCGIPEHLVDAVLITAVAWRVTPGGRPLIDRRRRCRCERNMPLVARYLQDYCGVPQGELHLTLLCIRQG